MGGKGERVVPFHKKFYVYRSFFSMPQHGGVPRVFPRTCLKSDSRLCSRGE